MQQVQQLQQRKAALQASNTAQRAHLSSLTAKLRTVYDRCAPLHSTFFPSATDAATYQPVSPSITSLPLPLYHLYYHAASHIQHSPSPSLHLTITTTPHTPHDHTSPPLPSDPTSTLLLTFDSPTASLTLRFSHIPTLHLVTVTATTNPPSLTTSPPIPDPAFLHSLFPDDDGTVLPTLIPPPTRAARTGGGGKPPSPAELDSAGLGRAYMWVQDVCGVSVLRPEPVVKRVSFREVVEAVRARLVVGSSE